MKLLPGLLSALLIITAVNSFVYAGSNTWSGRPTAKEYWRVIRTIAADELSRANLELELDTGYSYYFEEGEQYPGNNVSVGVKFPLYSAKEKKAKRDAAVKFQQKGAGLIADLEEAVLTKELYIRELPWLKMRRDDGIDAAREYIEIQRKIVEQEAKIKQAHRELQALIEPFTGTEEMSGAPDMAK